MDINKEYFSDKSDAEKLRNVSSLVDSIVNVEPIPPPTPPRNIDSGVGEGDGTEGMEVSAIDPLVDLVGKTLSAGRPKGFFMQGVQTDGNTKL
jgi:hypothetical protein|tara:strand:- start:977 stop:1255 length:279 start_codon:yes stop_codon:yes gene_type:complete